MDETGNDPVEQDQASSKKTNIASFHSYAESRSK
jgi:hypothetical protein